MDKEDDVLRRRSLARDLGVKNHVEHGCESWNRTGKIGAQGCRSGGLNIAGELC